MAIHGMAERWNGPFHPHRLSIILPSSRRLVKSTHYGLRKAGIAPAASHEYEDIYLPKNTPVGFYIGVLSLVFEFGITWHIYWLAFASFIAIVGCVIAKLCMKEKFDIIPASEVKKSKKKQLLGGIHLNVSRFNNSP